MNNIKKGDNSKGLVATSYGNFSKGVPKTGWKM